MFSFFMPLWIMLAGAAADGLPRLDETGTASAEASRLPPAGQSQFKAEPRGTPEQDVVRAIEHHYPGELRMLIEALQDEAAAHPGDSDSREKLQTRAIASFYKSKAAQIANAPAAMLNDINRRQLALIRLLAGDDPALCAEFATTAFVGRFDLPAWYQERASALGVLMIEASKAGEMRPADPERGRLTEGDAALWYEELLRTEPGDSAPGPTEIVGGDTTGTPEMQCRVGVATYAAIDKIAPDQAANVAAFLLSQTLGGLETE